MITVNVLENSDIIQPDDWVRQLSLIFTGQSDYLATNSTYGGSPINRLGWISAKQLCPHWVGKPVGEFRKVMVGLGRHDTEACDYEFIRGPIPTKHQERLTSSERRIAEMVWVNKALEFDDE